MENLNSRVFCSWFYFLFHPSQAMVSQGDTQGFGIVEDCVLPDKGESRGCMDYSAPNSVTLEEGDLHVRSSGICIDS